MGREGFTASAGTAAEGETAGTAALQPQPQPQPQPLARRTAGTARLTDAASSLLRTVWFGPAVVTALLSLWRAQSIQIWLDELTSVTVASRGWSQILHTVKHIDAVHAAYYLFLHLWMTVAGTSLLVMRLPGVAAMTGAAICVALTAKRLFGARAGLAAGLLFALTPAVARYATELRSYPFVALAAALASLLFVRALEEPSRRRWVAYAAALAATGAFNLISLTVVVGHALGLAAYLWRASQRPWLTVRRFAVAAVAGGALASPVAYYGARQGVPLPKPTLHDLFDMGPEAVSSVLGAGVLLAASAFAWGNPRIRQVAVATATAVAPVLFVWLVSRYVGASSFFFFARYLLFCVPAWAVLASAGITAIRSRRALTAVLLIFAVAVLPGQNEMHKTFAHSWYNYPGQAFPPRDYQAAARVIEGKYLRGDVSLTDGQADIDEGVGFYLPGDKQLRDLDVRETSAAAHDILPEWCSDYRACVDSNAQRVWLIVEAHPADPIQGLRPALGGLIAGTYTVSSTFRVTGLTVALLVHK